MRNYSIDNLIPQLENWARDKELLTIDSNVQLIKVVEELGEISRSVIRKKTRDQRPQRFNN